MLTVERRVGEGLVIGEDTHVAVEHIDPTEIVLRVQGTTMRHIHVAHGELIALREGIELVADSKGRTTRISISVKAPRTVPIERDELVEPLFRWWGQPGDRKVGNE